MIFNRFMIYFFVFLLFGFSSNAGEVKDYYNVKGIKRDNLYHKFVIRHDMHPGDLIDKDKFYSKNKDLLYQIYIVSKKREKYHKIINLFKKTNLPRIDIAKQGDGYVFYIQGKSKNKKYKQRLTAKGYDIIQQIGYKNFFQKLYDREDFKLSYLISRLAKLSMMYKNNS